MTVTEGDDAASPPAARPTWRPRRVSADGWTPRHPPLGGRRRSRRRRIRAGTPLRRFFRDPAAIVGAVTLILVVGALFATWFAPGDPYAVDVPHKLAHFSWAHPLGTDGLGRDMLTRMLYGGRTSVFLTLAVTAIITLVGTALGILAGMRGGLVDRLLGQVVDIVQAVPIVIVSMVTIALLGTGSANLVFVLSVLSWPRYTRVVRAATLSLRERDFIQASRMVGGSRFRIAWRHIVPNIVRPVVVLSTLDVGRVLLVISTLSFLGFGPRPPTPEWGSMLNDNKLYFFVAPRLVIIPGVAIFLVALGANLFGEGLRDAFDIHSAGN